MKDNLKIIREMDMEDSFIMMDLIIRDNGLTGSDTEKEKW